MVTSSDTDLTEHISKYRGEQKAEIAGNTPKLRHITQQTLYKNPEPSYETETWDMGKR